MSKVGVLIMRGQMIHDQHMEHIKRAALDNDTVVIVLGSINSRVSQKNPFSFRQRAQMIRANQYNDPALKDKMIYIVGVRNHPDNYVWRDTVVGEVMSICGSDAEITLYGSNKDMTSFYLHRFPEWRLNLTEVTTKIDATEIRELYFKGHQSVHFLRDHPNVPRGTLETLMEFKYNPDLQDEYFYYKSEGIKFKDYPYPSCLNINCADAVVKVRNKVMMIRRGKIPGRGCVACAGGHKEADETFLQAMLRELKEEAHINVSEFDLLARIHGHLLFDDPKRSEGPLTRSTVAFLIDLTDLFPEEGQFPEVYADDDAMEVLWLDIEDIYTMDNVYDDHAKIVHDLVTTFCDTE